MKIGVKSQNGITISKIKKTTKRYAARFFECTSLKTLSYNGAKITTRIIPKINDNNIGFNIRNANTTSTANNAVIVIFLKYSSSIIVNIGPNL